MVLLHRLLQCAPAEHGTFHTLREFLHAFEEDEFAERLLILHAAFTSDDSAEVFEHGRGFFA